MKKYMVKRISSFVLAFIMVLILGANSVFAGSMESKTIIVGDDKNSNEDDYVINENIASAIALLFVAGNIESSNNWSENTGIEEIIPLYDSNESINAYCIKLETNATSTGYIIIRTDINRCLIQEYSDSLAPVFEDNTSNMNFNNKSNQEQRIYYISPLHYSINEKDSLEAKEFQSIKKQNNVDVEETSNIYFGNCALVRTLNKDEFFGNGNNSDKQNGLSSYIDNPLTYLAEKYTNLVFQNAGWGNLGESAVPGYIISGTNACAMYGFAAVLTYHLEDSDEIGMDSRVRNVKQLAVDNDYCSSSNYYLDVGNYEPFGDLCISYYDADLETSSTPNGWLRGREEINEGRPFLLNIWKANEGTYYDHTVVAYAWTTFTNTDQWITYNFFKIRDGYSRGGRYVDVDSIWVPYYITRIRPR